MAKDYRDVYLLKPEDANNIRLDGYHTYPILWNHNHSTACWMDGIVECPPQHGLIIVGDVAAFQQSRLLGGISCSVNDIVYPSYLYSRHGRNPSLATAPSQQHQAQGRSSRPSPMPMEQTYVKSQDDSREIRRARHMPPSKVPRNDCDCGSNYDLGTHYQWCSVVSQRRAR